MTVTVDPGLAFNSKKPRVPKKEPKRQEEKAVPILNKELMAQQYGYALRVINAVPELQMLFERAVNDQTGVWDPKKFQVALHNTRWWNENSDPARKAFVAETMGTLPDGTKTADWQNQLDIAGTAIDAAASAMGARLTPEERERFVHRYIYEGWMDSDRKGLMEKALSQEIDPSTGMAKGRLMGGAGNLEEKLRKIAQDNGLTLSDSYFQSAARSVASSLTTEEDWVRDVRSQAASMWPPGWADKINAGADASSLASGYMNLMAQTLELDPSQIKLDDPVLRSAITKVDDKGNPAMVGLGDFGQMLRDDPRYKQTSRYTNDLASIAMDVMRSFGLVG